MKYIFANWKMYLNYAESVDLAEKLAAEQFSNKNKIVIFPSTLALKNVEGVLSNTNIAVGAQNVSWTPQGAYTGAVSAQMFKQVGCQYALIGHSERRHIFGETNADIRKKIEASLDCGLTPVFCVGETMEDRKENKREYRLKKQIMEACQGLELNDKEFIVAYEPVWAISKARVGEACSPEEADDVIGWIKTELKQYFTQNVPVIYGGSATAQNVVSLLAQETIDGVLPGNASTKFETFVPLIREAETI